MKVRELIRVLKEDGWIQFDQRGSHRQFRHPDKPGKVTIAGALNREIPTGTLRSILKQVPYSEPEKRGSGVKYLVIYEKGKDGYGAYVPDLPGCVAVGESLDDVKALVREAIAMHLQSMRQDGDPIPNPTTQSEYMEMVG